MKYALASLAGVLLLASQPRPAAAQDVVLTTPTGPVRLRFHVEIDGQPAAEVYRRAWDEYLAALFRHLDRDGDGFLSEAEGQRLPAPASIGEATSRPTNLAFNFRVVDDNSDGRIDRAEAARYYRDYGSPSRSLVHAPPGSVPVVVQGILFTLLDRNGDGRLTPGELAAAPDLMSRDLDGDELLAPREIAPRLVPPESDTGMVRVPASGRPRGLFSLAEAAGNPVVEFTIRLGTRASGLPVIDGRSTGEARVRVHATSATLHIGEKTIVDVSVSDRRPVPMARLREQILDQYQAADIGKKGHLTMRDAQLRGFFPSQFAILDRDLDGKVTRPEVTEYLDGLQNLQAVAVTSGVSMLGSPISQGLIDVLDENRDGRLSAAELRAAPRLLGLAGGESLAAADIPRVVRLAIGPGHATFARNVGGSFTPRGLPMLTLDSSLPGLEWFHRMDRNRDGTVSPREFLGPLETFRRLDANADGLLDSDEAPVAKS